ncbi:MAG: hypothetical protein AB9879_10050 [Methanothrix sp.]
MQIIMSDIDLSYADLLMTALASTITMVLAFIFVAVGCGFFT